MSGELGFGFKVVADRISDWRAASIVLTLLGMSNDQLNDWSVFILAQC